MREVHSGNHLLQQISIKNVFMRNAKDAVQYTVAPQIKKEDDMKQAESPLFILE